MSTLKKPIQLITGKNSPLAGAIIQTAELQQLNRVFHNTIDQHFAVHCQIAQYKNGRMLLIVDNAAWGTNLLYAIPDLIKTLRIQPEFKDVKKINYRINKHLQQQQTDKKPKKPPMPPNKTATENIKIIKKILQT